MYMRGVFFLILSLIIALPVHALSLSGELQGALGTDQVRSSLDLDLRKELDWCQVKWGWHAAFTPSQPLQTQTRWQLDFPLGRHLKLIFRHNLNHSTSQDSFRFINKTNFRPDSYCAHLQTDQLQLGLLRNVHHQESDVVNAAFVQSVLELGPLDLRGLSLHYTGQTRSGNAQVIEGSARFGVFQGLFVLGWQTDFKGEESQARLLEFRCQTPSFSAKASAQAIDPGFLSPLSKTNLFTPNRYGWQAELGAHGHGLEFGLSVRRHSNRDQSKDYNQLALELQAKNKQAALEWRIEPTTALILRYALADILFQLDPFNSTVRSDFQLGKGTISLRLDGQRGILRLQWTLPGRLQWRLIGKYDLWEQRSHCSLLTKYTGENSHIQLEVGQYDRGNMGAGFANPASFCISWGWKF